MSFRFLLAVAATLIIASGTACTRRKPPGTACDASCASEGACVESPAGCKANSDEDCQQSGVCVSEGRCKEKNGVCIAGSDADCAQSEICKSDGACTARAGSCVSGKEGEAPAAPTEEELPPDGPAS